MSKIGIENIPENIDTRYLKEEKEFLVLCHYCPEIASVVFGKDYYDMTVSTLGYIETATGRTSEEYSFIRWVDCCNPKEKHFKKDGIYRIKGRLPDKNHEKNTRCMGSLYVTEVISENERNDFLEKLWKEYKREVSVNSEIFGKMVLHKELKRYLSYIKWNGTEIPFIMYVEKNESAENTLSLMEDFYNNLADWDKKFHELITEKCSEFMEELKPHLEEYGSEIVEDLEKNFSENFIINDVEFRANGDFCVQYEDENTILNSIIISGNIQKGIKEIYLET
ncbi:MAG: DUF2262 domain-containing protein [Ruminococcus sp.]|nr:DUF2262 domain-containing protein [Ruminococcus sp.]